jgi:CRISPR-associated protein Cmr2
MEELADALGLKSAQVDPDALPSYSVLIHFSFRLHKPYLSKDDTEFYVIDNPVRKEKVFGLPMVAPTQWKGTLRAAMTYQLTEWWSGLEEVERAQRPNYRRFLIERIRLSQLFGNEKGVLVDDNRFEAYLDEVGGAKLARLYRRYVRRFVSSTGFRAGRLWFFPTFFTRIGLEVINPHDRQARVGKQPIYIESVPPGATGTFTLLYVPFDCVGKSSAEMDRKIGADLTMLVTSLKVMLTAVGFGAKTSSGFGVTEDQLPESGQIWLRIAKLPGEESVEQPEAAAEDELRRYWKAENQLKDEFLTPEGEFVSKEQYQAYIESLGQEYTKSDRQLFKKARSWWKREGRQLAEEAAQEAEAEAEAAALEAPPTPEYTFDSLTELCDLAHRLADELHNGGEA